MDTKTKSHSGRRKSFIFALILGSLLILPVAVHAQGLSISEGQICSPDNTGLGSAYNLARCANNIYIFAIAFGGFYAVLMFVIAGYMYAFGSAESLKKAKEIIQSTVIGLVLLFSVYAILNTIDPGLTSFKAIELEQVRCEEVNGQNVCSIPNWEEDGGLGSHGAVNGSILQVAQAEIGNREEGTSNMGPQINKYFNPGGTPGTFWCAYFVTWVYGQAGYERIGTLPGRGGVADLKDWFRRNRGNIITQANGKRYRIEFYDATAATTYPAPGDIAFFVRAGGGHVGIVKSLAEGGGQMTLIEGNASNQVKEVIRNIRSCAGGDAENNICAYTALARVVDLNPGQSTTSSQEQQSTGAGRDY